MHRDGLYGVGEVQLVCEDLVGDVYAEASAKLNGMEVPGIGWCSLEGVHSGYTVTIASRAYQSALPDR